MWVLSAAEAFCVLLFLDISNLAKAALPTQRASQRFSHTQPAHSPTFNSASSSFNLRKVGRHSGTDSLLKRPYCTLGRPGTARFASERIEVWVDPITNSRFIHSGNSSKTVLAAKCEGSFQADDCLLGHPMNGAPPDCSSLRCPCSVDTSLPSIRNGKLTAAQTAIVKEVGRLCARKNGTVTVLVLGLHHAVLPAYLEKRCPRRLRIDTVDSNQHIVNAAKAFMGAMANEHNHIECADSWQYLMRLNATRRRYDAVLTDCFSADGHIPATCRAPSFIARLRVALRPGGVSVQDIGGEVSPPLMMGYSAAFGKANIALLGPDEVPVRFEGSVKQRNDQMIRAVSAPLKVRHVVESSAQPTTAMPAAKRNFNTSAQSNTTEASAATVQ